MLLQQLHAQLPQGLCEVVDHWEADLCAIGLKNNERLAYISTYNYAGSDPMKYDLDLELTDAEKITGVRTGRAISKTELFSELIAFFQINGVEK